MTCGSLSEWEHIGLKGESKMKSKKTISSVSLALFVAWTGVAATAEGRRSAGPAEPSFSAPADSFEEQSKGDERYQGGKDALDGHRWEQAVEAFDSAIQLKCSHVDGAIYWKAYAQNKLGRRDDALQTLQRLASGFPGSSWLNDAKALEIEIRQGMGQPVSPENQSDEDLKLMAINSLLANDSERALPLLQKILDGNQSSRVKERALFVLAQSGTAPARDLLVKVARGNSNPDLQLKALTYLGLFGSKQSRQILAEIYNSSSDTRVKRQILHSYMTSGDRDQLLALAKAEKVQELRRDAIHQLGVLGARAELRDLYQAYIDGEIRKNILQALMVCGDADGLIELARNEKDPKLRGEAIRMLATSGGNKTGDALVSIYQSDSDASIRRKVVEGLFIQGNAKALIDLARKETNPEMKKEIVSKLSLMNSKEAIDYMMEILNK
jgi:HEAT repeat protein